jgi:hypothetical protein
MNLLSVPFESITFEDVVNFCSEGVIEGVQLDYKAIIPKDLTKHFVSFSNILGGLIIIGVSEDEAGLPSKFEGVKIKGKDIDRIHQFASIVVPLPSYKVRATNADKIGNVFILIKIDEGSATPYNSQNDPTVWVRTGNVSTPLKPANREDLISLVEKSKSSTEKRDDNARKAVYLFEQFLAEGSNEERQRKSINGQIAAINQGKWPFSPKAGYKRGYQSGIQELKQPQAGILRSTLLSITNHEKTPTQALIELNKSDFYATGRVKYKMDKFRKIVIDPFYAGILVCDKTS